MGKDDANGDDAREAAGDIQWQASTVAIPLKPGGCVG
jgi:hypothetical protein